LDTSTAGKAVIITNSGGETFFENTSTGGQARLVANTGGTVDISDLTSGGMTAGSIEGAGTYLLGSKALTVGLNNLSTEVSGTIIDGGAAGGSGGSLIKVGTGTLALSGANTYTGGTTISAGTLQLGDGPTGSILGNVINNATLAFDRSNTVTFGGLISGSGNLTQIGPGTTILTGDNAYTGGTTISEGTLQIGNGGTTGSITGNVTDNGSLAFDRSDSLTFSGAISGTGALVQSGSGTLKLTGANSYTGGTTISTGAFQVGNGGTTGSVTGNVTDNGILAFDRSDSVTFGGVIRGKGGLVELGGGTLTLTGNNTYSGGTTINAGTLVAAASNALGSGLVSVNDTSLLRISPGVTITNFVQLTDAGSLDNAAVIQVNAVGEGPTAAVTTSGGATITNAAEATISGLGLIGIQSLNGAAIVSNFGIISGIQGIRLNGGGTITNNAAGVITGTDGPAISTGAPVPVTVVNYGSITGATDGMDLGGRGSVTNSEGGTITGGDGAGILSSSGSPTITNSGTISGLNGISLTGGGSLTNRVGGTITGSSGVAILGSGGSTTVSNAGTINGSVSLGSSSNTVQLFSGSRINGALNLGTNSGTTLILDGAGNQTYSQAVTGATINAGSLTKQGAGNWLIDVTMNAPVSTNVLAGVLTVNGSLNSSVVTVETGGMLKGIGVVNGNLLNGGSVSPGNSPGTLTVNGNFTQGSSGVYNVEIVSPQSYSRLLVTGRANLDGTLQLTLASGFRPSPGQQFVVLSAGQGISGTFRSVTDPGGPPVQAVYQNGAVEVSAGSAPKAAPVFLPSDGTPAGTTALVSDYVFFNSLGSLAGRIAATSDKSIGITFDGGEFDFEGQHGQTYGFPIAGHLKLMDRVALDYEIPLQYVELPGSNFLEAGAILNFPIKMLIASGTQPWSWNVTPTAAIASTGSKEIMGAGALTNVVSLRWHSITTTYGNYISFFEGETLVCNDPAFPKGTSQQIMKNGLKVDIPFGKGWTLETYGIYTQFFQSAQVSSYYTIGAEVGRHIIWKLGEQPVDVGYYSVGLYTEQGNHYNSGHFQFGSGWKF
jgi:autotransporter-associated beta strand protein